jgi:hypothetical protein
MIDVTATKWGKRIASGADKDSPAGVEAQDADNRMLQNLRVRSAHEIRRNVRVEKYHRRSEAA